MNERVDLLVFGSHADDVELSCAGTILRAVKQGQRVGVVDLTRGEMGTRGTPDIRAHEAEASALVMGVTFRKTLDFGDGNLQTSREQELQIIRVIREHRPSVVLAPMFDDRHPDHARAGRLIGESAFYAGLRKIDTAQDAHRPGAVAYYTLNYPVPPSFIVDISDVFERKMEAVRCYASQFYDPNSKEPATWISGKNFLAMIEARARQWGAMIGAEFGEPFFTKTPPRLNDLVAAYSGRDMT